MLRCVRDRANNRPLHKPSRPSSSFGNSCRFSELNSNSLILHLQNQGYTLGKTIGKGSYCKVKVRYHLSRVTKDIEFKFETIHSVIPTFKIVHRSTSKGQVEKMACKIIDKRKASDDFVTKFLPRELSVIRGLRHPNIVAVSDVLIMPHQVYIFMDYCERGDLLDHIRARGALAESQSRHFFRQIVSAVQYLHSLDIAHRDLKCENVLLAAKDHVKIADFGFARWCHDDRGNRILSDTFCGSASYAAPEILQGTMYNPKMYDSWSLGCVLFIMLTASMPFDDANIPSMIKAQTNRTINFPERIDIGAAAYRLILHLLEPDITRRATMRQVARSTWLRYRPGKVLLDSVSRAVNSLSK